MEKKILICGATGFVGINLLRSLSKKFKLLAVYNKKPKFNCKNVTWVKADLRNYNDCLRVTKSVDIVIQAAATTSGSKDIINKPFLHVTDNAIMNSYLLKSCFLNKIKHFIFTSCTVMYQNSKKPLFEHQVDEKKIFPGYFGVAHTKLYVEKMCKFYSNISNIKFSIIRHSNLYGPFDKFDINKGHFIGSSIVKLFSKKKDIYIYGKGTEKRDYLYIDDFTNFIKKIITKQSYKFEIYNCSYVRSFKIIEILKKLNKISGKKKKIKHLHGKNLNINILVNSRKAKKKLNWTPKENLDFGLKKTIKWYQNYYE